MQIVDAVWSESTLFDQMNLKHFSWQQERMTLL